MNDVLQIVFSGVVAISTVVYAILTWKLVSETRKSREFQVTPNVNIYLERGEVNPRIIYIVFTNTGLGTARNVRFEILNDLEIYEDEQFKLNRKGIIKEGLDNFYPNQKHRFYLIGLKSPEDYEKRLKYKIVIRVIYFDISNKAMTKDFTLPFSELEGLITITPPDNYLGNIAYELSEIRKVIKK